MRTEERLNELINNLISSAVEHGACCRSEFAEDEDRRIVYDNLIISIDDLKAFIDKKYIERQ